MLKQSGIYKIENIHTDKCYVGSACLLDKRMKQHSKELTCGNHVNGKLQNAWNKYGPAAFSFSVLEFIQDKALLIDREQHWIDTLESVIGRYNIAPKAGSQFGYRHSDESKMRMSAARVGKGRGPEAVAKTTAWLKGRPKSPEHSAKVGAAHKGKVITLEQRMKISAATKGRKRGPCSPETRAKIAAAHTGKPKLKHTAEQRAARSAWSLGRVHSEESIARMRVAQKGRTVSDEARARMSAAQMSKAPATEETRRKISNSGKGRVVSQETRAKISAAYAARKAAQFEQ